MCKSTEQTTPFGNDRRLHLSKTWKSVPHILGLWFVMPLVDFLWSIQQNTTCYRTTSFFSIRINWIKCNFDKFQNVRSNLEKCECLSDTCYLWRFCGVWRDEWTTSSLHFMVNRSILKVAKESMRLAKHVVWIPDSNLKRIWSAMGVHSTELEKFPSSLFQRFG